MKHTPGPWTVCVVYPDAGETHCISKLNGESAIRIAGLPNRNKPDDHKLNEANACLIAAAPELLEALQEMMCFDEGEDEMIDPKTLEKARKAIAKAKGDA